MKPSGPLEERESVLVWSEGDEEASLWTASKVVYDKMVKLGWTLVEDGERHGTFQFPKSRIKLPRQKSKRGFASRKVVEASVDPK